MPKNSCIMQIWAESGKSALPICNYSQILYQFLTFTQNLKRSLVTTQTDMIFLVKIFFMLPLQMDFLLVHFVQKVVPMLEIHMLNNLQEIKISWPLDTGIHRSTHKSVI